MFTAECCSSEAPNSGERKPKPTPGDYMQSREGKVWQASDTEWLLDHLRQVSRLAEDVINRKREECKCRAVVR